MMGAMSGYVKRTRSIRPKSTAPTPSISAGGVVRRNRPINTASNDLADRLRRKQGGEDEVVAVQHIRSPRHKECAEDALTNRRSVRRPSTRSATGRHEPAYTLAQICLQTRPTQRRAERAVWASASTAGRNDGRDGMKAIRAAAATKDTASITTTPARPKRARQSHRWRGRSGATGCGSGCRASSPQRGALAQRAGEALPFRRARRADPG